MSLTKVSYSMINSAPFSVLDYGADPTGATDSAAAILAAFNAVRTAGGGVIDFPNNENGGTYTISYGFRIPDNCVVQLNGCTIQATTTFGQGTAPTNATNSSFFTFARPDSASPLASNIGNSAIIGDGALLDGRRDQQTGTVGGYTLITLKTTDIPAQTDNLKLTNILINDVVLDRSGYDGLYVQGVRYAEFNNVRVERALRIGIVGISGTDVTFNNCQANYTVGDNPNVPVGNRGPGNSGDGFWNEPDYIWQFMTRWVYNNCQAKFNYQSGFKPFNAGANALFEIQLNNCYAYSNVYDATVPALRSSPGFAQFEVGLNNSGSTNSFVMFNNCVADTAQDGGFLINKGTGATTAQRIFLENCVAMNCNLANTDSINRAPIHALTNTGTPVIVVNNPLVIAPTSNTLGYGIYFAETANVQINNPSFVGTFTTKVLNAPLFATVDLTGSTPTIATLGSESATVTITGAKVGDYVSVSSSVSLNDAFIIYARVTAADTVTYSIHNVSSGSVLRVATLLYITVNPNNGK